MVRRQLVSEINILLRLLGVPSGSNSEADSMRNPFLRLYLMSLHA